jgi:vancomycin resistance protein YoaR
LAIVIGVGEAGFRLAYRGRILPGVEVSGGGAPVQPVGHLTLAAAVARLENASPVMAGNQTVTLRRGSDDETWALRGDEVGLAFDPALTAQEAFAVGRRGSLAERLLAPFMVLGPSQIDWVRRIDREVARKTLEARAEAINVPPVDGRVERQDGQLVAVQPKLGEAVDIDATLDALAAAAARPGPIEAEIAMSPTSPRIGSLQNVAAAYGVITSRPVTMVALGHTVDTISVEQLKSWVTVEDVPNSAGVAIPSIVFDRDAMRTFVDQYADRIRQTPRAARFSIDPTTRRAVVQDGGRPAVSLDVAGSVDRLIGAAYSEERLAELATNLEVTGIPADQASRLDFAVDFTRAFSTILGQPEGRVRNIVLAAGAIDGVAIPAGATFSFNDALGEVSSEAGYDMVYVDDTGAGTAIGLGGGVTQVATTVYRAALWGGLPIPERHASPYRIGWLEPPIGLDATVAPGAVLGGHLQQIDDLVGVGALDLRIQNDSDVDLLVHVWVDAEPAALKVQILGAPGLERTVRLEGPVVSDVGGVGADRTFPTSLLDPGRRVQTRWAREGGTVRWERIVGEAGAERAREVIESRYNPVGNVVAVGGG